MADDVLAAATALIDREIAHVRELLLAKLQPIDEWRTRHEEFSQKLDERQRTVQLELVDRVTRVEHTEIISRIEKLEGATTKFEGASQGRAALWAIIVSLISAFVAITGVTLAFIFHAPA